MKLRRGQRRTLRKIERDIADCNPGLYAFFLSFNRRGAGRDMPPMEQIGGGPQRRLARRRGRMKEWCAENWKDP